MNNASSGPITDLEVDVYAVDGDGNRLEDACHPAKEKISVQGLLSDGMSGTLDAIGSQANSMYPRGMFGVPANLGSYGEMLSGQMMNAPSLSALLQNAHQQMVDKYPQVISRDQSVEVAYSVSGAADVRVDLQFADDMGDLWRRRHGQQPEPVMEGE
ncbi:hypothetical protein [Rhodococcus sp. H29-C3]|uniref:hypothetical protein n=1 Tax=Rhodococcus sp. H29-C3 TaxID=3046307 RepID=UPI0024BA7352|nr:hypothetical protein [Rhodococcus sp. H29-C3]MDJ0362453.1 hypothetical protein [Rhodococcus sp. H29-C3]